MWTECKLPVLVFWNMFYEEEEEEEECSSCLLKGRCHLLIKCGYPTATMASENVPTGRRWWWWWWRWWRITGIPKEPLLALMTFVLVFSVDEVAIVDTSSVLIDLPCSIIYVVHIYIGALHEEENFIDADHVTKEDNWMGAKTLKYQTHVQRFFKPVKWVFEVRLQVLQF